MTTAVASPEALGAPQYHVEVKSRGGQAVDITDRVLTLAHKDSGGRDTPTVEISLDNGDDYVAAQPEIMRKGAIFDVSYGYPGIMRKAGEWIGKEHKGNQDTISVTAHARKKSKMVRKMQSRTWVGKTRSEVVAELLGYHGIPKQQQFIDSTTDRLDFITQSNENDWLFMQRLADLEGRKLWTDDAGVHWRVYQNGAKPTHLFRYVKGVIGVGVIKSFSIDSFGAGIPGRIALKGRDPVTKKAFVAYASDTETKDLIKLTDTDDVQTVEQGDQTGGDTGHELIRNTGARSYAEAKRLADSLYKEYRYNALKVDLDVIGDPTLRTNKTTLVWGLGPLLDGKYLIKEVTHNLGNEYACQVKLARDGFAKKKGRGGGGTSELDDMDRIIREMLATPWKLLMGRTKK